MVSIKTFDCPKINTREILRYSGVKNDDGALAEEIESCLRELGDRLSYKVCYTELSINDEMIEGWKDKSFNLSENLEGCESVILFAATVGLEIDRLIARYGRISPSRAMLFQAVGAERIEALCNAFNDEIKCEFREKGLFAVPRFSPGYGDFPLSSQKEIFARLDCSRKIGLFLNKSMLMSPSKSVTAIIGFSKTDKYCASGGCPGCTKTDCEFRR